MGRGLYKRNKFLPMLCSRHSTKQVRLPKWDQHHSSTFSEEEEEDPNLSPIISCIGQIKRHNKVIASPTSQKLTFTTNTTTKNYTSNNIVKYSKITKFFYTKNLNATTNTLPINSGFRSRRVPATCTSSPENGCNSKSCSVVVNIEEMDPPLPVIKRLQKPTQECKIESLWKRRHGADGLKGSQIQQIQLTGHLF